MKTFLAAAVIMLCGVGCEMKEVELVFFNLSSNEIVVDSIAGLPPWASPGVLVPVHAEDQLSESTMTSFDQALQIGATLKIVWQEGGASHHAEFKRSDLGLPAKLKSGKIRFTYLGKDKWRITRLK